MYARQAVGAVCSHAPLLYDSRAASCRITLSHCRAHCVAGPRPLGEGTECAAAAEAGKQVAASSITNKASWAAEDVAEPMAAAWNASRSMGGTQSGGGILLQFSNPEAAGADLRSALPAHALFDANVEAPQASQRPNDPAVQFFSRYGYMIDDLVGESEADTVPRVRYLYLTFYLISMLQRCLSALLFGLFHFHSVSIVQIAFLLALHVAFTMYLFVVRPYTSRLLWVSDLLAYMCELLILVAASLLLRNPSSKTLPTVLITCYFVDVAIMIVPELLGLVSLCWGWFKRVCIQPPRQHYDIRTTITSQKQCLKQHMLKLSQQQQQLQPQQEGANVPAASDAEAAAAASLQQSQHLS